MKKHLKGFTCGVLFATLIAPVAASASNSLTKQITAYFDKVKSIVVDGKEIAIKEGSEPFIANDKVYVPLRFIAESLDKKVDWSNGTVEIYGYNENNPIDNTDFLKGAYSTAEMCEAEGKRGDAWKAEVDNLMYIIENMYVFQEDKLFLHDIRETFEIRMAKEVDLILRTSASDITQPPDERFSGTLSQIMAVYHRSESYKRFFFDLIDLAQSLELDINYKDYKFIFK